MTVRIGNSYLELRWCTYPNGRSELEIRQGNDDDDGAHWLDLNRYLAIQLRDAISEWIDAEGVESPTLTQKCRDG